MGKQLKGFFNLDPNAFEDGWTPREDKKSKKVSQGPVREAKKTKKVPQNKYLKGYFNLDPNVFEDERELPVREKKSKKAPQEDFWQAAFDTHGGKRITRNLDGTRRRTDDPDGIKAFQERFGNKTHEERYAEMNQRRAGEIQRAKEATRSFLAEQKNAPAPESDFVTDAKGRKVAMRNGVPVGYSGDFDVQDVFKTPEDKALQFKTGLTNAERGAIRRNAGQALNQVLQNPAQRQTPESVADVFEPMAPPPAPPATSSFAPPPQIRGSPPTSTPTAEPLPMDVNPFEQVARLERAGAKPVIRYLGGSPEKANDLTEGIVDMGLNQQGGYTNPAWWDALTSPWDNLSVQSEFTDDLERLFPGMAQTYSPRDTTYGDFQNRREFIRKLIESGELGLVSNPNWTPDSGIMEELPYIFANRRY